MSSTSPTSEPTRYRAVGVWLALAANALGLCAGAVFLGANPGDRFRGMEPVAATFSCLAVFAGSVGLIASLVSGWEGLCRGKLWAGLAGMWLGLTPFPLAVTVARFLEQEMGLIFD